MLTTLEENALVDFRAAAPFDTGERTRSAAERHRLNHVGQLRSAEPCLTAHCPEHRQQQFIVAFFDMIGAGEDGTIPTQAHRTQRTRRLEREYVVHSGPEVVA